MDDVMGLYFAQARYYSPELKRFLSPDTHWTPYNCISGNLNINVPNIRAIQQSANLYAYVLNNPLLFTDLTGEFLGAIIGGAIGAIGGGIGGGISAAIKGEDIGNGMLSGIIGGAIGGATAGAIVDIVLVPGSSVVSAFVIGGVAGAVGGGVSSMTSQGVNHYLNNNTMDGFEMSWREVAVSSATGAVFNSIGTWLGHFNNILYPDTEIVSTIASGFFSTGNALSDIINNTLFSVYDKYTIPIQNNTTVQVSDKIHNSVRTRFNIQFICE
jgi:RHS repeat-associated protein